MENRTKEKVYNFILQYTREYGYAPSIREIAEGIGLKFTSSVHSHLKKLQEEGKIEIRENSPRAIKIIGYRYTKLDE